MNAIPKQAWADSVRAISKEAAGVIRMEIVQPADLPELMLAALGGDAEAASVMKWVSRTAARIEVGHGTRKPMLCASCPRPLRPGRCALVIVIPARDDASAGLSLAVCRHCATTRDQVKRKATVGLRRIWPDLRAVDVHPTAGRA